MSLNNSNLTRNLDFTAQPPMNEADTALVSLRNLFPLGPSGLVELYLQRASKKHDKAVPVHLNVDWDCFRKIFEGISDDETRKSVAERSVPDLDCQLLHLMCISDVPTDVLAMVLGASSKPIANKSTTLLGATPLHCACLESSAQVVGQLLAADRDSSVVLMQDSQGRLPLHNACISGLDGEAPLIVEFLLENDVKKQSLVVKDNSGSTPLMVACEFASAKIISLLLDACVQADKIADIDFKLENMSNDPLLHKALLGGHRRKQSGVVLKRIIDSEAVKDNVHFQDRRGQIPLHHAVRHGADVSAFRTLIDADTDGTTFASADFLKQTPFDLLVRRINDGRSSAVETMAKIVAADTKRRLFAHENADGYTPLDSFCKILQAKDDITAMQKDFLRLLLMATPPGKGNYSGSLQKSKVFLGQSMFNSIFNDRRLHITLNEMMWKRSFTTHFMLDLYFRILLVIFYTIATNRVAVGAETTNWHFAVVYISAFPLLFWQVELISNLQLYYIWDGWNILDFSTEILVIVSAALLHAGNPLDGPVRVLATLSGGLIWSVIVVSALRSTFLPFAVFVRGFSRILIYMIPFIITTFLLLGAFAEMYFKSTVETSDCEQYGDFCSYGSAFLAVYVMFVGGLDTSLLTTGTSYNLFWLSLFYSFLFAIVMLNILVAVIFDAWSEVSPQGRFYFWRYRHSFLVETSETVVGRVFNGLSFNCLDALDVHMQQTTINFSTRAARVHEAASTIEKVHHILLFLMEGMCLFIWCCLGLITAGILWPGVIRRRIFVVGIDEEDGPEEKEPVKGKGTGDNLLLQLKEELEITKETTELELKALKASIESSMKEIKQLLLSSSSQNSQS